jgi:N-acetylglucosamine-6-phosphate deacetylase
MRLYARRFDTSEPVCLEIERGTITRLVSPAAEQAAAEPLPWIAPGLMDLQVNGYGGQEFSSADLTVEKVSTLCRAMDAFGVTRFCPTVTTNAPDVIEHALRTIAAACRSPEVARRAAGIHLEGPYLTPENGARGAHPLEHCRRPDWDEFRRFQDAAGGNIRILTMSVEFEGSPDFVRQAARSGVLVSIGHTSATPDQVRAAVDAGARMSTHLGNGSHPIIQRHRNYLWVQLADDRLAAGLICDGHHLPPEVVKTFVRAKTPQRCILVSDLSGMAGLPVGRHPSNLCDVEVLANGKLIIAGQTELLAGASAPVGVGVANVMHFAGLGLAEAVAMATEHPAAILGLKPARIEPGSPADLVLFDLAEPTAEGGPPQWMVRATINAGEVVFGAV